MCAIPALSRVIVTALKCLNSPATARCPLPRWAPRPPRPRSTLQTPPRTLRANCEAMDHPHSIPPHRCASRRRRNHSHRHPVARAYLVNESERHDPAGQLADRYARVGRGDLVRPRRLLLSPVASAGERRRHDCFGLALGATPDDREGDEGLVRRRRGAGNDPRTRVTGGDLTGPDDRSVADALARRPNGVTMKAIAANGTTDPGGRGLRALDRQDLLRRRTDGPVGAGAGVSAAWSESRATRRCRRRPR